MRAVVDSEVKLAPGLAARAKCWSDATERIRARTDASAKALAALGTTGITAAGLSKFSDIFPLPSEPSRAQLLANQRSASVVRPPY